MASDRSVRVQRQMNQATPKPTPDLAESASPFLAGAIGSVTIDGFETGKADISPINQDALAKTARTIQTLLKKYPGSGIHLIGHTDAVGKDESNQVLGQARAESVQTALASMGIPAEAIATESKGETQLLVKTGRAEARNRRVEVRFEPHTTRSLGISPDKYSTAATPSFGGGFRADVSSPIGIRVPPTSGGGATGGAAPVPEAPVNKDKPPAVGEIKALTELIKKTADATKKDPLVRQLRDALAGLQPFMPNADFKKEMDKAIDSLVKQGVESGIMAILEAVTGRSATPVLEKRDQTGPLMREKKIDTTILKGPSIPINDAPKPAPNLRYKYRDVLRKSYVARAPIKFTLTAPDKPMQGGKRLGHRGL